MSLPIIAHVYGYVGPIPGHRGAQGLEDAEDVTAWRRFRSVGAAMTWARLVLDGRLRPRFVELAGPVPEGTDTTPAWWHAAIVADDTEQRWELGNGRTWYEVGSDGRTLSAVPARIDA